MPTVSTDSMESEGRPANPVAGENAKPRVWIGWSSFFFAVLQSVCTFFATVNGLRLAIGIGALALSGGVRATVHWLHSDAVRVPMIVLALLGTLLNLVVLWQIRRLRNRPAAQWRQKPVSARTVRMERAQLVLSIVTLVLIVVEESIHLRWHGHL